MKKQKIMPAKFYLAGKIYIKILIILMIGFFLFSIGAKKAFAMQEQITNTSLKISVGNYSYMLEYPEIIVRNNRLVVQNLDEIINTIYFDTKIDSTNAKVVFNKNARSDLARFIYLKEKNGKCIDKALAKKQILNAIKYGTQVIKLELIDLYADLPLSKLKECTQKLSKFNTHYEYSGVERKTNIKLASGKLNGVIVQPNEIFSFNEVVGKRTEENGFLTAKVIENKKFVDGIGGGVCQVSTTLYNTALLAGLDIIECRRHSLAVSYVPPSFDAMVNDTGSDLKFKNNRDMPIYIVSCADDNMIEITIYGKTDWFNYDRASEVVKTIDPNPTEEEQTDELFVGEIQQVLYSKKGIVSVGYLLKYKNGKLVEQKQIRADAYSPQTGLIKIGTKEIAVENSDN